MKSTIKKFISAFVKNKTVNFENFKLSGSFLDYGFLRAVSQNQRESKQIELFKSYLKPDLIVFDIGAHLGCYSLLAGKNCKKVFSFEVHPRNLFYFKKNIAENHISNVTVVEKAVSNTSHQKISFWQDDRQSDFSSILAPRNSLIKKIEVETITIDDFSDSEGVIPNLIKMDIEGAEPLAFSGMKKLLDSSHPLTIFFECNPGALKNIGSSTKEVLSFLESYHFECFAIDENSQHLEKIADHHYQVNMNFIALRKF